MVNVIRKLPYLVLSCLIFTLLTAACSALGNNLGTNNGDRDMSEAQNVEIDTSGVDISDSGIDMDDRRKVYLDFVVVEPEEWNVVSLSRALEGLGSKIVWEDSTGHAYFELDRIEYVCQFRLLNSQPAGEKQIFICITDNLGSINNADYIQLNPMAANGLYRIIDDEIYLGPQSAELLFKALGYKVGFDEERTVMIISK